MIERFTAVFGGSFDPPHQGHIQAVSWLLTRGGCARVIIVPCWSHAFDKDMASFEHRMEMCRLAFLDFGDAVLISDVESALPAPSYTINTLLELHAIYPDDRFRLVIGSDILAETDKWREFDRITEIAPPIVLNRAGFASAGDGKFPEVSSTQVRELLASGVDCSELIHDDVFSYINRNSLYAT